jgi:hypothetical protein
MSALKIIQIGGSPRAAGAGQDVAYISATHGDTIYFTATSDGSLQLSTYDPEVAREIVLGEQIMDEYADTFRALARD